MRRDGCGLVVAAAGWLRSDCLPGWPPHVHHAPTPSSWGGMGMGIGREGRRESVRWW